MITRDRASAWIFPFAAPLAGPLPDAGEVTLIEDLTATIKVPGLPCGQVVSTRRHADNDYVASCRNGSRYRIFVNVEGRVVAQKQ